MIMIEDAIRLRDALARREDPITLDEALAIVDGVSRADQIAVTKVMASLGWFPRRVAGLPGFARSPRIVDYARVNWRRRA